MIIASHAKQVLDALNRAGYEAWTVGGCVRDSLMGKEPHDWDIATAAPPEAVKAAIPWKTHDTGLAHGTVTAVVEDKPVEITTFRVDGTYSDSRRPDSVSFTPSLEEDLRRRDFTINAMAANEHTVFDPFGGREDLAAGIIRTVGNPADRFGEDALRILRGLRFAAVLGFEIEGRTGKAILDLRQSLDRIAGERIGSELVRLLTGVDAVRMLRDYTRVFTVFLPEIAHAVGFEQHNRHHVYDVWEHTLQAIAASPPRLEIRLCLLFHDLGKPHCFTVDNHGTGHFYGHGEISANLSREALRRLRFDKSTITNVETLVSYHDTDLLATEKSVRRWLRRMEPELLRKLIEVKRADNLAQSPAYQQSRQQELRQAEEILEEVLKKQEVFSLSQLAVNGHDIVALGVGGPATGKVLDLLLEDVIEERCPNEKAALLERARDITGR